MRDTTPTIWQRLAAVQAELHVPKAQRNTFAGYTYRSCEDIVEAVKPLLREHELVLTLSDEVIHFGGNESSQPIRMIDSKGKESTEVVGGDRFYVKATAMLADGESVITTSAFAREAASKKGTDESQITGTASSYARKYALNGLFAIDDTNDADTQDTRPGDNRSATTNAPVRTHTPRDAANDRPTETPQQTLARTAGQQNDPEWQKQNARIHALVAKLGDDHSGVKALVWLKGHASVTDAPVTDLKSAADWVEKTDPPKVRTVIANARIKMQGDLDGPPPDAPDQEPVFTPEQAAALDADLDAKAEFYRR